MEQTPQSKCPASSDRLSVALEKHAEVGVPSGPDGCLRLDSGRDGDGEGIDRACHS
jgi:hypothetical protein